MPKIKDMTREQWNEYCRTKQRSYREQRARERLAAGIPKGQRRPQPKPGARICKGCGQTFPYTTEYFHFDKRGYGAARCKPCMVAYNRTYIVARKYGMTLADYQAALQGAHCAICGDSGRRLVMDHCHELNVLRGVLCDRCNILLGSVQDDISILEAAIAYLRR